ncbi:MAG: molybdopterin-dependent oxidoreductase [Myxococcales bacterium]
MREQRTTWCRICEATCGLVATVEDGKVVDLAPDPDHVVSKGYACAKGLRQHLVAASPSRLRTPLRRTADGWAPASWDEALAQIGSKVRSLVAQHGPDSVALYLGNPLSFSMLPPILAAGFLQGLGSRSLFQTGSQDCNNKFAAAQRMYGFPFVQPFPDVDRTSCLVIVGANPAVSKMTFVHLPDPVRRLKAIEERGGRVFHVNPRRTETAHVVGRHLFIRPGTDVFFYLSFLHEVVARLPLPAERVRDHVRGFGRLARVASGWAPERTAEVTGIAPAALRELVETFLAADGAALYSGTGVNQGGEGTLCAWLQEAINAITGNLDRLGGTLVGKGYVPQLFPTLRRLRHTMRDDRTRVGALPSVVDSFPAGVLADEILTPGDGRVRALIVLSGNPLFTVPNPGGRLEKALQSLELLVSVDLFRNETGALGHWLLPGASPLQRADLPYVFQSMMGVQPRPSVQYTDAVARLEDGQRDETWILLQLARACGSRLFGSRVAQAALGTWLAAERLPLLGSKLGLSPERLLDLVARGMGLGSLSALRRFPHGKLLDRPPGSDFLGERVLTDDGLVDLAPPDLVAAAAGLSKLFERERAAKGELRLFSKREARSHNSWLHGGVPTNHAFVHPQDAAARGIADGEPVVLSNESGTLTVPARVSDEVMPGSVALPHGWGHPALAADRAIGGANTNLLMPDGPASLEPFSGMARMTGLPVELKRKVERNE